MLALLFDCLERLWDVEDGHATRAVVTDKRDRLAELYQAHAPGACRLAYLLTGDLQVAEDVTQEAFLKLFTRFADLRSQDAFAAYLRKTIVNLCRSRGRRKSVEQAYTRRARAGGAEDPPDLGAQDAMRRALDTLPPRQRAALVLRYYEDLSEQQAADALNTSVAAVKSLVQRGSAALRKQLEGEDDG